MILLIAPNYYILFYLQMTLICFFNNYNDLMCTVNTEHAKLSEYFCAKKLSLNIKKSNYMLFRSKSKLRLYPDFDIKINHNSLQRVQNAKFLGVFIDDELSWKYP